MEGSRHNWIRWAIVAAFAIAMAWVEAAAVVYIRTVVDRIVPHQAQPLPVWPVLANTELAREAATLVMLGTMGWLAGNTARSRLGYLLVAFGLWDIFYYLFLWIICGWPGSLLEWDVLFLIPLPWWGPVLAPMLIAALMVAGGTSLALHDQAKAPLWPRRWPMVLNGCGVLLALYVFMTDALAAVWDGGGVEALQHLLPAHFPWPLFLVAVGLMAVPVGDLFHQIRRRKNAAFREGGIEVTSSADR